MPRSPKSPAPHLQPIEDAIFRLDLPPEQKAIVMEQRAYTRKAFLQLGAAIDYCLPRSNKPLEDDEEEKLHRTDDELKVWIDDVDKQGLNAAITLHQGVLEVSFYGADQTLNACFFVACAKLGVATRYAFGQASKDWATSILFKLSEDDASKFDDDYAGFRPKSFSVEGSRRGAVFNYGRSKKRGKDRRTLMPGSVLMHEDMIHYDLFEWRSEAGSGPGKPQPTQAPLTPFFSLIRASAYATILNLVEAKLWEDYVPRRAFSEWLARVVRDGQAINANIVFAKVSRAIISDPQHAEQILTLICEQRSPKHLIEAQRTECLGWFQFAKKRLETDPTRQDVSGWAAISRSFNEKTSAAFRAALYVGAESTLLEDLAERYLFHHGSNQFIDRKRFNQGLDYLFSAEALKLRHAPDQIKTLKKPVEAFPLFVKSKLRRDVAEYDTYPDYEPGAVICVNRNDKIVADDDFAPEHSRLVFNEWHGLYVQPAKSIEASLRVECEQKLDQMLRWVTNRNARRADWIKAHFGWTLKHPGKKQQVALVCTGDQGTGKSFLCTDFAQAIFGHYASTASVRALNGQFYIAGYVGKLWVSHDEFVSNFDNAEILKTLIRSTRVAGELKGRDATSYTLYARLAFTSNEANPGISRGRDDRGLFQVTSISPASEGMLPSEFQKWRRENVAPFYENYFDFLKREDVRETYVKLLIDCAPSRMAEVEDLTHSAMRDEDVARAHLSEKQIVAKTLLESGVIHSGYDIAMPFQDPDFFARVGALIKEMGVRRVTPDEVMGEYIEAGLLERPGPGKPYLFKYKIGALQRIYGDYLGVPLHSQWPLEPNDDMPNDWRDGDPMEPWKGRGK